MADARNQFYLPAFYIGKNTGQLLQSSIKYSPVSNYPAKDVKRFCLSSPNMLMPKDDDAIKSIDEKCGINKLNILAKIISFKALFKGIGSELQLSR